MKKTITVTKEIDICDECKTNTAEIKEGKVLSCDWCKKTLCHKCKISVSEYDGMDWKGNICSECASTIYEKYLSIRNELTELNIKVIEKKKELDAERRELGARLFFRNY